MSLTREYCSAIERAADLMNHGIHFASFNYGGLYQFAIKRQTFVLPLPTGLRSEVSHAKGAAGEESRRKRDRGLDSLSLFEGGSVSQRGGSLVHHAHDFSTNTNQRWVRVRGLVVCIVVMAGSLLKGVSDAGGEADRRLDRGRLACSSERF
jgi:hypothetical protein